jgi:hypothetical protein
MALVPVSILFEIFFASLALILYRENLTLERLVAVGLLIFEIPLLTLPQQFYTDASGTLTLTTIAFPAPILGYVVFAMFLLIFVALYRWWELYLAQRNLRQVGP